ncbi:CPBP family intramembrane metalloprotease [Anaerolineae bacterium CFX7]|nr:CPBP family intramembrane metalloprotease [Anaerolineae bacterium CFX7]
MDFLKRNAPAPIVWVALALAFVLFGFTFRGPRKQFWQRMTYTGAALGPIALAAQPQLRKTRFTWTDVVLGLSSAGVLYAIFQVADRVTRKILPGGARDIDAIYGLDAYRPKQEIAARLALIIGPAEELFWRGFIQERFMNAYGRIIGTGMATAAYGGAHLVAGNFTLIGAATVAGAFWGGMAMLGATPGTLIISHAFWDVFIFLIAPTQERQ